MERSWVFFAVSANEASLRRAVADRLAETEKVLVVDRPASAVRQPARWGLASRVSGHRYEPFHTPEAVPLARPMLRAWNVSRLRRELDALLPPGERILCYDTPTQAHLVGRLGESRSIYLAVDDRTVTVTGEPIAGNIEAEERLLGAVDAIVCVSEPLARTLEWRVPKGRNVPLLVVENGFDERLFDGSAELPCPPRLAALPRPLVLVAGYISGRLDWGAIADCRRLRPDVHWAFLGRADRGMPERIAALGASYVPPVPLVEVPAWMQHADICAVPYRLNAFTAKSSPLKAFESLAMGAPTLSTRIPSLRRLETVVAWVDEEDGASYADAIDRLLAEGRLPAAIANRQAAVAPLSLSRRFQQFRDFILELG